MFLDQKIKLNEKLLKNYLFLGISICKNHNTFYKNIKLLNQEILFGTKINTKKFIGKFLA